MSKSHEMIEESNVPYCVCMCLGLKMMVAEPSGTKIVFLDAKNQGYVFNPINDTLVLIRDMPPA